MKKFELLQKLKEIGAVYVRHGGKHDVYMQPKTNKESAIPRHDEIDEYTAKSIIKKLS
jgi:mRNA interferase HicA